MIKDLLERVTVLEKRNEYVSKLKRESFNIFSVLRKDHEEEKLHSAFIAELLDSEGSHGLGDTFSKIFFEQILKESTFTADKSIRVNTEKQIEEGRTDIYLKNNSNQVVVIENKIYATDQDKQLVRYANHGKFGFFKFFKLYYLTLDGTEPDKSSTEDGEVTLKNGEDYFTLSYRSDILSWMKLCLKEVADYPTLRETIKQYIILIKKLTGQLIDEHMGKEIHLEIKNNYKAAKIIADNFWKVKEEVVQSFLNDLGEKIKSELSDEWELIVGTVTDNWSGIHIVNKNWIEGVGIRLEGQSKILSQRTVYGIRANPESYDRTKLKELLAKVEILKSGFKESPLWPFYKEIMNLGQSPDDDKIFDTEGRQKLINQVAEKVVHLCEECKDLLHRWRDLSEVVPSI